MKVAVLGLGRMGTAMAGHVLRAGHDLVVWDRTPGKAAALLRDSATQAATPGQAARDRDAVVLALFGPDAVHEVLFGPGGVTEGAVPATLVIDATTVGPDAARQVAVVLRRLGLRYLEAPVVGSVQPAQAGTLGVLAGGDAADYAAAEPLLRLWGDPERIRLVGPIGSGNALKVVLNLTLGVAMAGIAEARRLGADLGLDAAAVLDGLAAGPLGATVAAKRGMLESGQFQPAAFSLELLAKDLTLAVEAGRRPLPVTQAALRAAVETVAAGHGGDDMAGLAADRLGPHAIRSRPTRQVRLRTSEHARHPQTTRCREGLGAPRGPTSNQPLDSYTSVRFRRYLG